MKKRYAKIASLIFEPDREIQVFSYRLPASCGKTFCLWLYQPDIGANDYHVSLTTESRAELAANRMLSALRQRVVFLPLLLRSPSRVRDYKGQSKNKLGLDFQATPGEMMKGVIKRREEKRDSEHTSLNTSLPPISPVPVPVDTSKARLELYLEYQYQYKWT